MAKEKVENLISKLHQTFGNDELSPQQEQLINDMKAHLHNWDEPEISDPTFRETAEILLNDIKENHPKAALIAKEIIDTLNNIGV